MNVPSPSLTWTEQYRVTSCANSGCGMRREMNWFTSSIVKGAVAMVFQSRREVSVKRSNEERPSLNARASSKMRLAVSPRERLDVIVVPTAAPIGSRSLTLFRAIVAFQQWTLLTSFRAVESRPSCSVRLVSLLSSPRFVFSADFFPSLRPHDPS